ncbi:MAG: CorA family divalent cation transporter [Marinilabiliales bacterium]|nr:CorA family divalent cation transporter [Marinilabiliales bacterium]
MTGSTRTMTRYFYDPLGKLIKRLISMLRRKQVFGYYASTLAVNTGVIWIMTLLSVYTAVFQALTQIAGIFQQGIKGLQKELTSIAVHLSDMNRTRVPAPGPAPSVDIVLTDLLTECENRYSTISIILKGTLMIES